FVGITFTVFWGTLFPIISEAVRGVKITVGPPFYNSAVTPIGLTLLLRIRILRRRLNKKLQRSLRANQLKENTFTAISRSRQNRDHGIASFILGP
ncbi:cytochrome c-type biogenesis CcmF C-terminal domain-containing protein, partial [Thermodesulfobacteriota bacterium]